MRISPSYNEYFRAHQRRTSSALSLTSHLSSLKLFFNDFFCKEQGLDACNSFSYRGQKQSFSDQLVCVFPPGWVPYKCCNLRFMALLPTHLEKTVIHSNAHCKHRNSLKIIFLLKMSQLPELERRGIVWSMQVLKPYFPSIEKKVALVSNIKGWKRISLAIHLGYWNTLQFKSKS